MKPQGQEMKQHRPRRTSNGGRGALYVKVQSRNRISSHFV
jgi:hypothetical protein